MKKVHQKIGALIREHRIKSNLSQLDVARELGYESPQFVSMFERGLCKIPYETIGHLIVLLGLPERKTLEILVEAYKAEINAKITVGKKSAKKR